MSLAAADGVGWLVFPPVPGRRHSTHRLVLRRGDDFYEGDCMTVVWEAECLDEDFPGWAFIPLQANVIDRKEQT